MTDKHKLRYIIFYGFLIYLHIGSAIYKNDILINECRLIAICIEIAMAAIFAYELGKENTQDKYL